MAHFYFENVPHGKRRDGSKLNTKSHFDYISCEGKYAKIDGREEDLVYAISGNMPSWAFSPSEFWQEAERNRRANGRAYREFRFALQEEFTLAENVALVERFLDEFGIRKNHAYSLAIHDKAATFDPKHRNIHCHVMFSEKVIEKDRPLSAECYFKQYAVDRQGNAVSGYRTSRQFVPKETTYFLRQRWAELCNEKFAEKGLDCRISEKSLATQRAELLESGRPEEAHLLDRTPAPHLGKTYRNPRTMERIRDEIALAGQVEPDEDNDTTDGTDASAPTADDDNDAKEQSVQELKILLFANDVALRRIAKEIQSERQRLAREQANLEEYVQSQDEAEQAEIPMAVTVQDIRDHLQKKQADHAAVITEKMAQYRQERQSIIAPQRIRAVACDRLLGNAYFPAIQAYSDCKKQEAAIQKKLEPLYADKKRVRELAAFLREERKIKQAKKTIGLQLHAFKERLNGDLASQIPAAEEAILAENKKHDAAARKLYGEIARERRKREYCDAVIQSLSNRSTDEALFTEKIPRLLDRYCKIDGTQRVAGLRTISYHMDSYAMLQEPDGSSKQVEVTAVRLGDSIQRGTVPKYKVTFTKNNRTCWQITAVKPALDDDGQPEIVRLYPKRAKAAAPHAKAVPSPAGQESKREYVVHCANVVPSHAVYQAHQTHAAQHSFHVLRLADAFLEKEKSLHPIVQLDDKTETRDKAIQAEERIYKGMDR